MRITRRPSGGRGEYEISEASPEGITPNDLLGREIILELPDGWCVRTGLRLTDQGKKRRLRIIHRSRDIHVARQLAAALLLPEPVRYAAALGAGEPVMQRGRYFVEHVLIERAELMGGDSAVLKVGNLILRNRSVTDMELPTTQRTEQVRRMWDSAGEFPEDIAQRLRAHKTAVLTGEPIPQYAERLVRDIEANVSEKSTDLGIIYSEQTDVLGALESSLEIQVPEPVITVDEVDPEQVDVRVRTAKQWKRWANARGPKSAVFRERVRRAYRATCLVCGRRYPPTATLRSAPGVDAAHILPWSQFDLDEVFNGLCLCKLHHWAFDEALIVIRHSSGQYAVEVPDGVESRLLTDDPLFSVEMLQEAVGEIPSSRLPASRSDWPRPQLLDQLNSAPTEQA